MSVSAGTTRIVAMQMEAQNFSFDMEQRDPNNLNNHLQVRLYIYKYEQKRPCSNSIAGCMFYRFSGVTSSESRNPSEATTASGIALIK